MACNGDSTTNAKQFTDLPGQMSNGQLPTGVNQQAAAVSLTAQVAAKATTTLFTPTATGLFRIGITLKITTIGTSPVIGPVTITYTDGDGSVAQSQVMSLTTVAGAIATSSAANSTTLATLYGDIVIFAKTGVAIQYAIAQTGTIGSGQWSAHIKCEAL